MSSGEIKNNVPFPDKGSPEEQTAWRKENGIPADYTGYWGSMKFDNGLVIGDQDKPLVNAFLKEVAHTRNWSPAQAKQAIEWHFNFRDQQQKEIAAKDMADRTAALEHLDKAWPGADRKVNEIVLGNFLNRFPREIQDAVKNARGGDGVALLNNAPFMQAVVAFERDINPMATVVPNAANPPQAVESEIAEIKKQMGDKNGPYWKGPMTNGETQMQARYRELVTAQQKMQGRSGKAA
jgi:hypothetical protein